jgi:hypothetical protein
MLFIPQGAAHRQRKVFRRYKFFPDTAVRFHRRIICNPRPSINRSKSMLPDSQTETQYALIQGYFMIRLRKAKIIPFANKGE